MGNPVGKERPISTAALAEGLKGLVWGLELDGTMYDAEFTGKITVNGEHVVRVRRKSDKQRNKS